jgi:hypothetical protein
MPEQLAYIRAALRAYAGDPPPAALRRPRMRE